MSVLHVRKPRKPNIITADEAKRIGWLQMMEVELEDFERDLAKAHHWMRYHTWSAKHSPDGFPDDVLVRGPDLIFLENKREADRYQPSAAQSVWLHALQQVRNVHAQVVKPHDMDAIAELLERGL